MSGALDWTDTITIMQARGGKRMAKTLLYDGTFLNYDDAYAGNHACCRRLRKRTRR
jgi:hypothetical protein